MQSKTSELNVLGDGLGLCNSWQTPECLPRSYLIHNWCCILQMPLDLQNRCLIVLSSSLAQLGVSYLPLAQHPRLSPSTWAHNPACFPVALDEKVGCGVMFFKAAELQRWLWGSKVSMEAGPQARHSQKGPLGGPHPVSTIEVPTAGGSRLCVHFNQSTFPLLLPSSTKPK